MPFVEVDSEIHLYYETWGHGQPVVFVHALSMDHRFWEPQIVALADQYRVIIYDQRGHGASEKPDCDYSLETYTNDLHCLIAALELSNVLLVGCSIGSWVALDYACRNQPALSRLVLVSASPRLLLSEDWNYGVPREFFERFLHNLVEDRTGATHEFYKDLLGPRVSESLLQWVVQQSLAMPLLAFLRSARNVVYADRRPALSQVMVPTLILNGADDRACPRGAAEYMTSNIQRARFVALPDSGHFPNLEEPSKFNTELRAFFAGK